MFTLVILAIVVVVASRLFRSWRNPWVSYPPGPRGLPAIGNGLQIPVTRQWIKFSEWAKEYGPIFHLSIGPQHLIVLNTPEVVEDLFVKQNKTFSDRVSPYVAAEIVSGGQKIIYSSADSPEFKVTHRVYHQALNKTASRVYRPIQQLESAVLLKELLSHVDDYTEVRVYGDGNEHDVPDRHWFNHVRRMSLSIARTIVYGERVVESFNNPVTTGFYETVSDITRISLPGAFLVDTFPILKALPNLLAPWRAMANEMHAKHSSQYLSYLQSARNDLLNLNASERRPGNLVQDYLRARTEAGQGSGLMGYELPGQGLTEEGWMRDEMLANAAASLLEAAAETTAGTVCSFVLAMVGNPRVVKKAQEELDRIVGRDRLPSFEDEDRLPYVVACMKETVRCRPAAPLAIPHCVSEDTTYKGYFIPQGAAVFGNIWALQMDEKRFPEPTQFKPERWLNSSSDGALGETKPVRLHGGPERDRDKARSEMHAKIIRECGVVGTV
ncbi:hypothetical protein PQX77_012238 [Marasmius sp. AFHP31]|nr:hypothetical protein PQX77_012238 [Marasmius sp. AFHP31]